MRFALFTPEGTRRLTPDSPGRMAHLMSFWLAVTIFVFGGLSFADEPGELRAGHVLMLLLMLWMAVTSRRHLTLGVFASETALHLRRAGACTRVELDQVQAFTLRSDDKHPRVLWVDLADGRRYPTPAYLGDATATGLALTRTQMDTLIADLTRHLPNPATTNPA
ncbi:hypothetical protein [Catellatospora bangladeshensis]|uniref:Uncharacterized protein n=1 Tax=Catellatospora bangladeshensis TaxID=310355 RepID=A0A8J3JJI8_9ACTN|nr:hypothetical protein [Catellatospora bangladeshensis]GIF85971.1 hypothetical protein Cba03nite_73200 [Catellatospora bangladeshensis]